MNKSKSLFIHATNIHSGGGRTLLLAALKAIPSDVKIEVFVDKRMILPIDLPSKAKINITEPTVFRRLKAEWLLSQSVSDLDTVLCFGSLPPLFNLKARTIVFVQNKYLITSSSLKTFPLKTGFRLWMERLWFSARLSKAHKFIVQTPSMKESLLARLGSRQTPVEIYPFLDQNLPYHRSLVSKNEKSNTIYDFAYIASGEPHKNHRRLIEAWCLLSTEGLHPSLVLTIDFIKSAELCTWLKEKKEIYKLNITNLGELHHDQIKEVYKKTKALVFPSVLESFGIPLIEARQAELSVVAAELDYVRDILDPEESFDPFSVKSIARAIKRFQKVHTSPLPLIDASDFLRRIVESES